jgi:hypothetical protein
MPVSSAIAYGNATTNLQLKPAAEPKTQPPANNLGSRSSRDSFPSSSN